MKNETSETIHLRSTVIKRRVGGTEVGAAFLLPGEETIPDFTTRVEEPPPVPPQG